MNATFMVNHCLYHQRPLVAVCHRDGARLANAGPFYRCPQCALVLIQPKYIADPDYPCPYPHPGEPHA